MNPFDPGLTLSSIRESFVGYYPHREVLPWNKSLFHLLILYILHLESSACSRFTLSFARRRRLIIVGLMAFKMRKREPRCIYLVDVVKSHKNGNYSDSVPWVGFSRCSSRRRWMGWEWNVALSVQSVFLAISLIFLTPRPLRIARSLALSAIVVR